MRAFAVRLDGRGVTKKDVAEWKEQLYERGYAPVTVNSMLAALHSFFDFADISGCKAKYLKYKEYSQTMTGGMGTGAFTVVCFAIMVGVAEVYYYKRRRYEYE
ncbi:MAG: site-specific integrase [Oscillospiraceae bacterium]|nr:site-specific integrase [Oscillospiraceae bacterium]